MKQVPVLFLGDSPSIQSGLSRIGRDLAYLVSGMEEFRVGYLGRGGLPSRRFPFLQYDFNECDQWGENWLQAVWEDFSAGEEGVVFTVWDPSRLLWFGNPVGMPNEKWLRKPPFKKWGYFAVDSEGPFGGLSAASASTVRGYDRVLAYSLFGSAVLTTTLGEAIDYIPHGVNMDTFMRRDGRGLRMGYGIPDDVKVVGCVMTNQARKEWPTAFETLLKLKQMGVKVKGWFKVDVIDRYWDMRALATDYNVWEDVIIDIDNSSDKDMSYLYSMFDVTILPSSEGFGYPIVESLACGTPCIHSSYAGGAELIPEREWLVDPVAFRVDTRYNCRRPVFDAAIWADAVKRALDVSYTEDWMREKVIHLNWPNLAELWKRWFREGVTK